MINFLNPLDALIPKTPFPFFILLIFGSGSPFVARGSVLVGFGGSRLLSPFWGVGGGLPWGLYQPPPPPIESPPAPFFFSPKPTKLQKELAKEHVEVSEDAAARAARPAVVSKGGCAQAPAS